METLMAAIASDCITEERQGLVTVTYTVLIAAGTVAYISSATESVTVHTPMSLILLD